MSEAAEPTLSRNLRARHVEMISIGGIIGAGLFVGSSAAISAVGPAVILSYLAAGLIILMIMRMLSEMAASNPHVGSFTEYVRLGLGHWGGFVAGWLYWYFWVVVVAIEAIAGARIISLWLPVPSWEIGLLLMVVLTIVNLMSARSYGEFEFWFASIKVAAILAFIVLGLAAVIGVKDSDGASLVNLVAHGGFFPKGVGSAATGVVTVIFALCGAEIATIAAAESSESARTISRLTITIVFRILLFYVVSIFLILCIVPWNQVASGVSPFAVALGRLGIPGAETVMNFVVLTAVLSCLNSGVYVTSRVLMRLAEHGDAPQALVKLSARRVPARAILIGSVFGYAAVIASIVSPARVFAFLVNASGALMLVIYLLVAAAQISLRRRHERDSPERLTIRMWLFPWLTYATMAAMAGVLLAMLQKPSTATEFYTSSVCVAVVAVACWFRLRGKSAPKMRSPA
jgi:GABA permease